MLAKPLPKENQQRLVHRTFQRGGMALPGETETPGAVGRALVELCPPQLGQSLLRNARSVESVQ